MLVQQHVGSPIQCNVPLTHQHQCGVCCIQLGSFSIWRLSGGHRTVPKSMPATDLHQLYSWHKFKSSQVGKLRPGRGVRIQQMLVLANLSTSQSQSALLPPLSPLCSSHSLPPALWSFTGVRGHPSSAGAQSWLLAAYSSGQVVHIGTSPFATVRKCLTLRECSFR